MERGARRGPAAAMLVRRVERATVAVAGGRLRIRGSAWRGSQQRQRTRRERRAGRRRATDARRPNPPCRKHAPDLLLALASQGRTAGPIAGVILMVAPKAAAAPALRSQLHRHTKAAAAASSCPAPCRGGGGRLARDTHATGTRRARCCRRRGAAHRATRAAGGAGARRTAAACASGARLQRRGRTKRVCRRQPRTRKRARRVVQQPRRTRACSWLAPGRLASCALRCS
eukprot:scaffold4215_cov551-Prasinococcus_capsulatus_cf.AAC.1